MEVKKNTLKNLEWPAIQKFWPGLFFIVDAESNIHAISRQLLRLLSYSEEEILGKSLAHMYALISKKEDKDDLKWRLSLEYVHRTGNTHRMNVTALKVMNDSGNRVSKYYRPVHTPVLDDEEQLLYIIHTLEPAPSEEGKEGMDAEAILPNIISDGVYEIDFNSQEVHWNHQLYQILGYKTGEINLNLAVMLRSIHHEDRQRVRDLIREEGASAPFFEIEYRLKTKSGDFVHVLSKGVITRDRDGQPLRLTAVIHDISHYKEHERLRNKLELITSTIPAMICYIDKDLKYQFMNSSYQQLYGLPPEQLVGKQVKELLSEEAYRDFAEPALRALKGEELEIEFTSEFGYNEPHFYKTWYVPDKDPDGAFRGFIGMTMDLTKEKYREMALNNATEEKQRLLDQLSLAHEQINREKDILKDFFMEAPALITIFEGPEYTVKYMNKRASQVVGDRLIIGEPFKKVVSRAAYEKFITIFDRVCHQRKEYRAREFAVKSEDIKKWGAEFQEHSLDERFFDFVVQPTLDVYGHPNGVIIYANEITDLILGRRIMQREAERDRMLLEAMPIIAYAYDTNGDIEYVNSKWHEYTGINERIDLKQSLKQALHQGDLDSKKGLWKNCLKDGTVYDEYLRIKDKDGAFRWHHARVVPVCNDHGVVIRWIGTCTDINEQVEANKKKDEFITIASHELKTPLTSVKAYLQLAQQILEAAGSEPVYSYLSKANKNVEKLQGLISELLDVSRIQSNKMIMKVQPFHLDEMIKEVIEYNQRISDTHHIKVQGRTNIVMHGDRERLEQIINNLLSNAIKYSPDSDEVIVRVAKNNGHVQIDVVDFGVGISEKDQERLFEQFYRSERAAKSISGLGIGLYISMEIARQHGGQIMVKSEEGMGSVFSLILPVKPKMIKRASDH